MADFRICEEPLAALSEHALIPITFEVDRILDVSGTNADVGGIVLTEHRLGAPYMKDYDAIHDEGPTHWAERFDMSAWGLISAHANGRRIGGAVIAINTEAVEMLEGRNDLGVLWGIRVHPDWRGQRVGSKLLQAAEKWAIARRCQQMKIETQNINVATCRFYASLGYELGAINRFAYERFPDEIQLLWDKNLRPLSAGVY